MSYEIPNYMKSMGMEFDALENQASLSIEVEPDLYTRHFGDSWCDLLWYNIG